jgi:hypothetical protein
MPVDSQVNRRNLLSLSALALALSSAIQSPGAVRAQGGIPGPTQPRSESPRAPSPGDVHRAIELATGYLERACGPDGKFAYLLDPASGRESSSYNILRHSGAVYALAMANQAGPDKNAVDSMLRAAAFLRRNYMGPGPRAGQLVIWSNPWAQGSDGQFAELGGTGLGLVALGTVRNVRSEAVSLQDLQALGHFILFLQRENGSFVHKYIKETGPVTNWQSLYYPGEAALGLIALYEQDHSRAWLDAATKALAFVAQGRAGLNTVPADHWALIATAKLLPYCDDAICRASRVQLIHHAAQICNSILEQQLRNGDGKGTDGAFDPTGRTAPAATRLEGLLAALEFLPPGELRQRVEEGTQRGIAFLLRTQFTSGPYAGGIPGSLLADSRIRIDFVQHALCAWIAYRKSRVPKGRLAK